MTGRFRRASPPVFREPPPLREHRLFSARPRLILFRSVPRSWSLAEPASSAASDGPPRYAPAQPFRKTVRFACRLTWPFLSRTQLDMNVKREPWSKAEDARLIASQAKSAPPSSPFLCLLTLLASYRKPS